MTGIRRSPPGFHRPLGQRNAVNARVAAASGGLGLSLLASLLGLLAVLALSQPASANGELRDEIQCLALNIYFEARGEPDIGKRAVGHVVLNRVSDERFPQSICDVVRQGGEKRLLRCQFSWWCDGRSDEPEDIEAWERSKQTARSVFWGFSNDPTAGALWYHAAHAKPGWRKSFAPTRKIGDHFFYGAPRERIHASAS